jgi:two-component system sensor histidine kinase BarA
MMQEIFDRDLALERAGGNRDLAEELFGMLLNELPDYREKLDTAHRDGNLDQVIFIAHRINGSATYTGVPALKAAAEALEVSLKQGETAGMARQVKCLDDEIGRVLELSPVFGEEARSAAAAG